jgi:hypothetical protein
LFRPGARIEFAKRATLISLSKVPAGIGGARSSPEDSMAERNGRRWPFRPAIAALCAVPRNIND